MTVHKLSRPDARRLAVRAQLLDARRPSGMFDVVRRLTLLQNDPAAAVAPSADLVLWSRLGSSYSPAQLRDAVDEQALLELHGLIRPPEDITLFRAEMAEWPGRPPLRDWQEGKREWVDANNGCRLDILTRLRADGPLTARELPDTCVIPWRSSGWSNNRNVMRMIGFLVQRGEVAAAGQRGADRLWDLAERIYPDEVVPYEEALHIRDERRLRALGIARARAPESPTEPNDVRNAGEPAVVEGVKGQWRVDPELLDRAFTGRVALLSPLDRLVYDRKRMTELFEYDYQLEMFKPAAKRRWGYWALPILHGDRLVGKLDATADRKAGVLRVDAIHQDVPFTKAMTAAVQHEIKDLASWLRLDLVLMP
ncbi:crosslink repair DNA glycosylase YcaQ family protein [Dactylosporangium fulvum]|uniref:Winged helix DNA-binding domain-containing protein n=1 Tax=Dactylosporangium fulvum TaxID=53359 RepID=A0ABY5WAU3_9ACTN|nr:crosslink repair DNA glycosylase YcaQ family protein [Dactylosporangium fulvum]UWP85196.1 winged helix DNA-binding domain-containing protein [Dactylosporangium fulvum]